MQKYQIINLTPTKTLKLNPTTPVLAQRWTVWSILTKKLTKKRFTTLPKKARSMVQQQSCEHNEKLNDSNESDRIHTKWTPTNATKKIQNITKQSKFRGNRIVSIVLQPKYMFPTIITRNKIAVFFVESRPYQMRIQRTPTQQENNTQEALRNNWIYRS